MEYPDYPFEIGRSQTAEVLHVDYRQWLNSRFRLLAEPKVRAMAFDLLCLSYDQHPVGTLPLDNKLLARLLNVTTTQFEDMMRQELSPLYGWHKRQCGKEVRWTHNLVLESLERSGFKRKQLRFD